MASMRHDPLTGRRALVLFGPQITKPSQDYLSKLRASVVNEPGLSFLLGVIRELGSLWSAVATAYPPLLQLSGEEHLYRLRDFIEYGDVPNLKKASNIVLVPLTVISHLVEFEHVSRVLGNGIFPNYAPAEAYLESVQGFCIGFLAAAAVASSRNHEELQTSAAAAIRIAIAIGALIDLDDRVNQSVQHDRSTSVAVRWRSTLEHEVFLEILKSYPSAYISCITNEDSVTVTISASDASHFALDLSDKGLSVQSVGLHGRYHHHTAHLDASRAVKDLCDRDERFTLPTAASLVFPLRSNANAEIIEDDVLHHVAIDSILTEKAQWLQTVEAAVEHMTVSRNDIDIVPLGNEICVPRSVAHLSNSAGRGSVGLPSVPRSQPSVDVVDGVAIEAPTGLDPKHGGPSHSAIAVVGMACRFPEANSLEEFWQLLSSGRCTVQELPESRFKTTDLWRQPNGPFWGNFIRDPDAFDHRFFGISGREAKSMDPQQRLLLQLAYEAMESSGHFGLGSEKPPTDVGCYVGVGSVDYGDNVASQDATAFAATGTLRAFISGRVSHYFGWTGPSITYDTACSSAAVAIHSACRALQSKECSVAVAGGVNVITSPALFQNLAAASFLNPSGASKAFDAAANGYCRGEGGGLVVLKPLANAIADDDFILSVIAGSAVNQGSNRTPITVPDSESQSSLYRNALGMAGVEPAEVSYVEAHGTGTPVGDPIECDSIRKTFGGSGRSQTLFVGSVKDNIGHTESASGAASLLKTILMLQKGIIPKQANFLSLNPSIPPLQKDRMDIPIQSHKWSYRKRVAVVNNYGAAGSNAAIVLQDHSMTMEPKVGRDRTLTEASLSEFPFFVSAKSRESLRAYCAALRNSLPSAHDARASETLRNVAYNLAAKQNRALEHSMTFTSSDLNGLTNKLEFAGEHQTDLQKMTENSRPVVLCFGGQSGTTIRLSENLFHDSKLLQHHLNECNSSCRKLGLPSILPRIFTEEPIEDIVNLHCMLFSLQYASAKSWLDCGLKVDRMVGHSFGQLTALCVANSLSLVDSLYLVSERARLIRDHWGSETGVMVSVEGDREDALSLLELAKQRSSYMIEVACYNGPRNVVLAGDLASIEALEKVCESDGVSGRLRVGRLKNTHAFHSHLVDRIVPGLAAVAKSLRFEKPSVPIEACSIDESWSEIDADKIVHHSRMPVYFSHAIERIAQRLGSCIWLEAGSGSPIIAMARRVLTADDTMHHVFQPIDLGSSNPPNNLAKATCELWTTGLRVQFWPFHRCQKDSYAWVNLPPYQFQKPRHWMEYKCLPSVLSETKKISPDKPAALLSLLERGNDNRDDGLFAVDPRDEFFRLCTQGHAVIKQALCPASLYVELVVRATHLLRDGESSVTGAPHVTGLNISSPLTLNDERSIFLRLVQDKAISTSWKFTLFSHDRGMTQDISEHATGMVTILPFDGASVSSRLQSLNRLIGKSRCSDILNSPLSDGLKGAVVYKTFGRVVDYANYYQGVQKVFSVNNEATGAVSIPSERPAALTPGYCDPVAVDNFLQVAGIHVNCLSECTPNNVFLCTSIGEILLSEAFMKNRSAKRSWDVYSNFESTSPNCVMNDIFVLDADSGDLVLVMLMAEFKRVQLKILAKTLSSLNGLPQSEPHEAVRDGIDGGEVRSARGAKANGIFTPTTESSSELNGMAASDEDSAQERCATVQDVRQMISDIMEIPIDEIQLGSSPSDLGIDSLMVNEVLGEILKRFDVSISASHFQEFATLEDLAQRIRSPGAVSIPKANGTVSKKEETKIAMPSKPGELISLTRIQEMLSDTMETPMDEIDVDASFSQLGVDSLMATEILAEIKKRFDVTLSASQFAQLSDVRSLHHILQSSLSAGNTNELGSSIVNGTSKPHFGQTACEAFVNLRRNFDTISQDTSFGGFYQEVYPYQAELVLAYVVEAFSKLGCSLNSISPGQRLPDVQVVSKHMKLKQQIYRILEDSGVIALGPAGIFRADAPLPSTSAVILHQAIVDRFSQHISEHRLLHSTGAQLADCLAGRTDPLSLVFGNAKARQTLEDVYTNAPMFKSGTILLAQYLTGLFSLLDDAHEYRILELGAGTGGTTKYLIDKLIATNRKFTYTFTDISPSLVAAARKKFGPYDFMRFEVMDIEQEPSSRFKGQYDVVISTNCIHATRNLSVSCSHIRELLSPDGILCLVELTRNLFWFDLVFGLLEGWWLFNDGRKHVLAHEELWHLTLRRAGYHWIDWTKGDSRESELLRVITASPSKDLPMGRPEKLEDDLESMQTVVVKQEQNTQLLADIYYPRDVSASQRKLPVALLIHGGGHIMLSRKDIRPKQTELLLQLGFLPISIDYRLCPETNVIDGPMKDVCDALDWARNTLPNLALKRRDVQINGDRVVAVGWSTGGHLALSLAWTAPAREIKPPTAIFAFYCPTDYQDPFWGQPNFPFGSKPASVRDQYDVREGVFDRPITAYNPPAATRPKGGWMVQTDPRSRIALHMNWRAQTLPILLNGLDSASADNSDRKFPNLTDPPEEQVQAISPLAQINAGNYKTPTFLVHGTSDDLVPWQQTQRTYEALVEKGVASELRVLDGAVHLFDIYPEFEENREAVQAVKDGYDFLCLHAKL